MNDEANFMKRKRRSPRLKVGDRVRVVDPRGELRGGSGESFIGKIGTIRKVWGVLNETYYATTHKGANWWWQRGVLCVIRKRRMK